MCVRVGVLSMCGSLSVCMLVFVYHPSLSCGLDRRLTYGIDGLEGRGRTD